MISIKRSQKQKRKNDPRKAENKNKNSLGLSDERWGAQPLKVIPLSILAGGWGYLFGAIPDDAKTDLGAVLPSY